AMKQQWVTISAQMSSKYKSLIQTAKLSTEFFGSLVSQSEILEYSYSNCYLTSTVQLVLDISINTH
ncbi:hypothetical protein BDR06DRAFT_965103, partial [Suillus hirtellus]